jgi:rhodanese-related sulfurtransferase
LNHLPYEDYTVHFLRRFLGEQPPSPAISPAEAFARLTSPSPPFVLDVRQPIEFQAERLTGAISVPVGEVSRRLGELPRDREILCVCLSGHRSEPAVRQLRSAGFKAVGLAGGLIGWRLAGLPTEKGSSH